VHDDHDVEHHHDEKQDADETKDREEDFHEGGRMRSKRPHDGAVKYITAMD
jgi:hypothetical protein